MRRVIVVGAGLFGMTIAARLHDLGLAPLVASRRGLVDGSMSRPGPEHIAMDAEDEASLRSTLRAGDVIVDTAGPFALRTTRLVRVALDLACDVIDLAESLAWSEAILALEPRAAVAGVRLYPACSAVAAVAGACVRAAAIESPVEVDLFLAPASAQTASVGTMHSFVRALGRPIRTFRGGRMTTVRGYTEGRPFPSSRRRGGIVEHAGAVLLPRSWPTIQRTEFWVDPNAPPAREMLMFAAKVPPLAALARRLAPTFGPGPAARHDGTFAVEIRDASRHAAYVFSAERSSFLIAVEPAVIVAEALARGATPLPGVVLPHAQIDPQPLFARLRALQIHLEVLR